MAKKLISFSGSGGTFPFQFGIAKHIRELKKDYHEDDLIYAGTSAGCLSSLYLALNFKEQQVLETYSFFNSLFDRWWKTSYISWFKNAKKAFWYSCGKDAHRKVSGRLHISISFVGLRGLQNEIVSHFSSSEDLLEAISASCHLPLMFAHPPVTRFRNRWALDGDFTNHLVTMPNMENILFNSREHGFKIHDYLITPNMKKFHRLYDNGYKYAQRSDKLNPLRQSK